MAAESPLGQQNIVVHSVTPACSAKGPHPGERAGVSARLRGNAQSVGEMTKTCMRRRQLTILSENDGAERALNA